MLQEFDRQQLLRGAGRPCSLDGRQTRPDGSRLYCIPRDGYEPVEVNGKIVNARRARARMSYADSEEARRGSALEIDGRRYSVENVEPDAYGWNWLELSGG